ncbi:ABC transporter permease subunit [Salinarimonas soli]|uniref:ABC transporter permease subunit n=2 Tax=Salinarimonas soli TaxID=1638099 RepID=A0A5B2VD80_9HYPH|nr:ABC transporter permease subunit [Salinarimonas soli]
MRAAAVALAVGSLLGGAWLDIAPNRLLPGRPALAVDLLGAWAFLPVALAAAAALLAGRRGAWRWLALALAGAALLAAAWLTGSAAAGALAGRGPAARAMLGAGFWGAASGLLLLALAIAAEIPSRRAAPLIGAALAIGLVTLGLSGALDALSPVVEARARGDRIAVALVEHLRLAGTALLLALGLAVPLAWAAFRSRAAAQAADAALGLVQVVPAIALFALLIPLLSLVLGAVPALRGLGLSALGATPALVGVALYAALPLFRALLAGLTQTDPAAVDAARAMGMSEARIVAEIRLPLGLPLFFGGLRVAAVQTIGLVTLGGLVGAGGLGAVVFEAMSQFAPDLILVAAAPVVALAMAADGALLGLERLVRRLEGLA